ncbi:MAG: HAMP domain-containing protein [Desulfobulbaceae bacterium]|nr:HAMP domain-containing protein [Desulfobulbaceae bacterium]
MKKKVYLALFILVFCFTGGGLYITRSTEDVVSKLEIITTLHQVEFFRKDLQSKIKTVQTDLLLKDSPHALDIDEFTVHVEDMEKAADLCFTCHHSPEVLQSLTSMQNGMKRYIKSLSRVYTTRANRERLEQEKGEAFNLGKKVLADVQNIVITSSDKIAARIARARKSIDESQRLLFFFITIGPFLLILITYFFLDHVSGSVSVLIDAIRKIKEGDLQVRVKDKLSDEFLELATVFNEMAGSLKEQCLYMQHAERLAVVGELSAGLAHEVKNPLAGIKVSIEVLANDLPLNQEDRDVFYRIINEIHRIEALLKSLINYARPPEPRPKVIDVHELLASTIKNAKYSLVNPTNNVQSAKKIEFIRDFSSKKLEIMADQGQLQQVFLNLLLNAVDAIPAQGTITVKTRQESNGAMQISVSDNGKGIHSDNLGKIFKPFFTTKPKGTGLGLSICKRLIELHDGTIHLSSQLGEGTTVYITLPEKHQPELVKHEK